MTGISRGAMAYLALACDHTNNRGFWPHRHRDKFCPESGRRHRRTLALFGLIETERVTVRNPMRAHCLTTTTTRVVVTPTEAGRALIASYRSSTQQMAAK